MKRNLIKFIPILISILLVFTVVNCKKSLRPSSVEYIAKDKVIPLTFTSPSCSPTTNYIIVKKGASSFINFGYSYIYENTPGNDYRSFELRPGPGGSYCFFNFVYLRQQKSANYELMSRATHQKDRGYNNVEIYGQMSGPSGPGILDSDQGGYVHVEYRPNFDNYKITICDVPMSFKYNGSGIIENVKVSAQFISE